jgi:hypothetical protein
MNYPLYLGSYLEETCYVSIFVCLLTNYCLQLLRDRSVACLESDTL